MTEYPRSLGGTPVTGSDYPAALPKTRNSGVSLSVYRAWGKRFLDVSLVLLAAPAWLIIVSLCAVLIIVFDRQNPFFSQSRFGRNGRVFRMWKLRTMVANGDAVLADYLENNPEANIEWITTQKLRTDPRITKIGRFLRKTSLDELPQLFNVLMGDMSLVGPRPFMAVQQELYPGERYYLMRPGLTGLWQIRARNNGSFASRVHYDDHYYRIQTLKTDMYIMFETIGVVMRATGH